MPYFFTYDNISGVIELAKETKDEEAEKQIKAIQTRVREAKKAGIIGRKVRDVAIAVIKDNELLSTDDLSRSIPEKVLDMKITDLNLHDVGLEIKKIRDMQRSDKIPVRSFLNLLYDRIICL